MVLYAGSRTPACLVLMFLLIKPSDFISVRADSVYTYMCVEIYIVGRVDTKVPKRGYTFKNFWRTLQI